MLRPLPTSGILRLSRCYRCLQGTHSNASSFVCGWHRGIVSPHFGLSFPGVVPVALPSAPSEHGFASRCIYGGAMSGRLSTIASHMVTVLPLELKHALPR